MKRILLALGLAAFLATPAHAQVGSAKSPAALNTETNTNFADNTTGAITPAITRQMLLDLIASYLNVPNLGGDCTSASNVLVTCTKTNGVSFATSATTDTTNATNITSGTLGSVARLPVGIAGTVLTGNGTGNITTSPSYKYPPNPLYSSTVASAAVASWTEMPGPDAGVYVDACWSAERGLFVAGDAVTGHVKSSADGLVWKNRTAASAATWHGCTYAPALGLFVMVGGGVGVGGNIQTSPDGITWTNRTAPNTNSWDGLVWSPQLNLFVAVGFTGTGNRVMTSPDGVTWTSRTSAADNNWSGVAWAPELTLFVAVANSGVGNRVMTSPDGITWTIRSVATDRNWDGVVWAPQLGLFVAVSYSGTADSVMTSPDGITWTLRTTPTTNTWTRIAWSPELGILAATGAPTVATTNVMTSPDGINWTTHTTTNDQWGGIAWAPELGIFGAVSWSGTAMVSTPPAQKNKPVPIQQTNTAQDFMIANATVDFNSGNTDTQVIINLPTGFTRYRVHQVFISGANHTLVTATCGLFTAAAAGGTQIVSSASAITVATSAENTLNNLQSLTINNPNTQSFTVTPLFFRVQTAEGAPATATVSIVYQPLS